jgi:DNA-binding response OmpR family regulator
MKKLLIVDDNRVNSEFLAKRLAKEGFDAVVLAEGEECLNYLQQREADLILLDIVMPGISGFGVLRHVRAKYKSMELPVIMVTSREDDSDIIEALRLGANDYITKPVNMDVALARIHTQLNLVDLHKESLRLKELEALNAMIITYNHEINSPLAIAVTEVHRAAQGNKSLQMAEQALERIGAILAKVEKITSHSVKYTHYRGDDQMVVIPGR